jgi:cell division protein FtsL
MNKLNVLLAAALLASCLFLVRTAYESRQLFAALDRARSDQRLLDAEFKRLDTEAQAQSTHLRVDRVARDKLKMRSATPAITEYVVDPVAASSVASASPAGNGPAR